MSSRSGSKRGSAKPAPRDTSEFDQEFVADTFEPPSRSAKAQWQRAKRKAGRPTEGKGHKVISVSIERGLLERSDVLAKKKGITRARLIARGLRAVLAADGADAP
ncbi:MAG: hypothetical protein JXQ73_21035 [Phycisphaerae bacterium]|nr:hypothetical protein [Phycisphaerae bacterium]